MLIIGGGGLQARAAVEAASRGRFIGRWAAVDKYWMTSRRTVAEQAGIEVLEQDALSDPATLRQLVNSARLVANFAGPFYHTGHRVLDECINSGTDYIDICDDPDPTIDLLARDTVAREAGIRALIGMGSSPGISNILTRAAVDAMGKAEQVEISWIVDVNDVGVSAAQHFWHIFSGIDNSGRTTTVPAWDELDRRQVEFPPPLGKWNLFRLSHPEPITLPRFLPVDQVATYGGLVPEDAHVVGWALARLGGGTDERFEFRGQLISLSELAGGLYERYRANSVSNSRLGGGLVVEVRTNGQGYRFASADTTSMEESTGTPAAAGIKLMLAGELPDPGVFAPECLRPASFIPALVEVSRKSGSLTLHRVSEGKPVERVRLRDLIGLERPAA